MSRDETQNNHRRGFRRRVDQAADYIRTHLDQQIDLHRLARLSAFSPFHFHRIMRAFLGEPVGAFIVRLRIEEAARLLRYTALPITEITYRVGYDTPSSLTKSFRKLFGISPSAYRATQNYQTMTTQSPKPEIRLSRPKIVTLESKTVLYIPTRGNYSHVDYGSLFERLWAEVKQQQLFTAGIEHLAIYHDNPEITSDERLQCDVCLRICKPAEPNGEIGVKQIPAGRFAVFTHTGEYNKVGAAYDRIYGEWLPRSSYETRSDYCVEKYVSDPRRTAPEKLKTEIYRINVKIRWGESYNTNF